jgi:hypothetical protein
MTEKYPYQTNEYIFFNPCRECIVKPCCSQKCKKREDFEHWLPVVDAMANRWGKQLLDKYEMNSVFRMFGKKK